MAEYRRLVPDQTVSRRRAVNDFGGSVGGRRFFEAMRRAGLPE